MHAAAPQDYIAVNTNLQYSVSGIIKGTSSQNCVQIKIVDDRIREKEESFTVRASSSNPRVLIKHPAYTISIVDNEQPAQFGPPC